MAIIKSSVRLIVQNLSHYKYSGKTLSLGVPEIYATYPELRSWLRSSTHQEPALDLADVKVTTNEIGQKLNWVTAETFFKALGLLDVVSVDIPGSEHHPDIVHDLNDPFPASLIGQFDLVFDPGTTEHVFDMKTALTNVVRALKVGGVVIHQVPVYSFNGGYYSINPNLLNDFYRANGFAELRTYIIMWDRYRAYFGRHRCYEYTEEVLGPRHALADFDQCRYSPHMLFFARKMQEEANIKVPLQYSGEYLMGVASGSTNEAAEASGSSFLKTAKSAASRLLPPSVTLFLAAMIRRWIFLYETRRCSFWV